MSGHKTLEPLSLSPHVASIALSMSGSGRDSPIIFSPNSESEEWVREWRSVEAKELVDSPLIAIDADSSVEDACDVLLSNNASCIAIKNSSPLSEQPPFLGLFDFADINAFLSLAASQHTISDEELRENPRAGEIVTAAKAGKVSVRLISNLSEKNPLEILPDTATLVDLLTVFATGAHRILIRSDTTAPDPEYLGFVTDRSLLSYFYAHAQVSAPLSRFLGNPLHSLTLPSLSLRTEVVSCSASACVTDAMQLMSIEGVSSVAVVEDGTDPTTGPGMGMGTGQMSLLSAVSVTDIGKIVVPSQGNQILQTPLRQFIAQIKEPDGSTDGADKYPVYSVSASSALRYAIEKILATNAHRVFVTENVHSGGSSPTTGVSPVTTTVTTTSTRNGSLILRGVVSVVDVLALFARLAGLSDVDPTRMQRHRRLSSAGSSTSSRSPDVKSLR